MWQTDGRTDTGRQQRLRLRIASRGKNHVEEMKKKKMNNASIKDVQ